MSQSSRLGRRSKAIVCLAVLSVAALVAACSSGGGKSATSTSAAASSAAASTSAPPGPPIKIGAIMPLSGTLATIGQAEFNGIKTAVALSNAKGGINGHPIDLQSADDQGTPAAAVAAMQSLSSSGVKFFVAGINSPICSALNAEAGRLGALEVTLTCFVGDLIDPTKYPTVWRANETNESITAAAAYAVCNAPQLKGKAVQFDFIGVNGATSTGQAEYLQRVLQRCGITEATTVFTDSSATDMLPYVSNLISKLPADSSTTRLLFAGAAGAQQAGLISSGLSAGLFKKYAYVVGFGEDTESFTAQASLGSSMPMIYEVNPYFYGVKSPLNDAFEPAYKAAYNAEPPVVAANGFISANAMIAALTKANSTDVSAVNAVMSGLTFPAFDGTETLGADHEGNVPELLHTFGPAGPQFLQNIPASDAAPYDTADDHAFAVAKGI